MRLDSALTRVALHAPMGVIVAATSDGQLLFIDQGLRQVTKAVKAHADAVSALAFTNSGLHLITGGHDGAIKIFDMRTMAEVFAIEKVH